LIWARAEGSRVWDADGREYIDLSGGFGVAALGHRNPRVMDAITQAPVVHALGDLADAEATAELRRALPWPAKLGVTGADAVEIGLRESSRSTAPITAPACCRSPRPRSRASAGRSRAGCRGRSVGARTARILERCRPTRRV
jgi:4-aminobutyrate aminotransferase-like enzyme